MVFSGQVVDAGARIIMHRSVRSDRHPEGPPTISIQLADVKVTPPTVAAHFQKRRVFLDLPMRFAAEMDPHSRPVRFHLRLGTAESKQSLLTFLFLRRQPH